MSVPLIYPAEDKSVAEVIDEIHYKIKPEDRRSVLPFIQKRKVGRIFLELSSKARYLGKSGQSQITA